VALRRSNLGQFVSDVDFDDRIPGIVAEIVHECERDERAIANEVARDARRLAPKLNHSIVYPSFHREPGWLAESIDADRVPDGGYAIRVGAFWGIFQEYGTENMNPQPYLRPAAEMHEADLVRQVRTTLKRAAR